MNIDLLGQQPSNTKWLIILLREGIYSNSLNNSLLIFLLLVATVRGCVLGYVGSKANWQKKDLNTYSPQKSNLHYMCFFFFFFLSQQLEETMFSVIHEKILHSNTGQKTGILTVFIFFVILWQANDTIFSSVPKSCVTSIRIIKDLMVGINPNP